MASEKFSGITDRELILELGERLKKMHGDIGLDTHHNGETVEIMGGGVDITFEFKDDTFYNAFSY